MYPDIITCTEIDSRRGGKRGFSEFHFKTVMIRQICSSFCSNSYQTTMKEWVLWFPLNVNKTLARCFRLWMSKKNFKRLQPFSDIWLRWFFVMSQMCIRAHVLSLELSETQQVVARNKQHIWKFNWLEQDSNFQPLSLYTIGWMIWLNSWQII